MIEHDTALTNAVDIVVLGITVGAWAQILPPIAAALSIAWLLYRFATDIHDRLKGRKPPK